MAHTEQEIGAIIWTSACIMCRWDLFSQARSQIMMNHKYGYIWYVCIDVIICYCCRLDEKLMVKVADFGLTRDMYISDYYVMSHSNPLPVKWLAPEVLFDKIFSEKTDVVSFSDDSNNITLSHHTIKWPLLHYLSFAVFMYVVGKCCSICYLSVKIHVTTIQTRSLFKCNRYSILKDDVYTHNFEIHCNTNQLQWLLSSKGLL